MRQTLTIANHALAKYLRSGRFLLDLLPAIAVVTFLFQYKYHGDLAFYGTMIGGYLAAQTVLTTALTFRAAALPTAYPVLARLPRRTPYLLGHLLAAYIPILLLYCGITIYLLASEKVAMVKPDGLDPAVDLMLMDLPGWDAHVVGAVVVLLSGLAMLLLCAAVATITALAMPLVSPRPVMLAILAVAAVGLYSFGGPTGGLQGVGSILALPLFPLLALFDFARTAHFQPWTWIALVLIAAYIVAAVLAARFSFGRRDLLL